MFRTLSILSTLLLLGSTATAADSFRYHAPGILAKGLGRTGDRTVYFEQFGFPLQAGPKYGDARAFANSQVYSTAGGNSVLNYAYPWKDTYCEARSWTMPLCPGKTGHQGVDIRPNAPPAKGLVHPVLAVADGVVIAATPFTRVEIRSMDSEGPFTCRYLHMSKESIVGLKVGATVKKGDKLGDVSNIMGAKPDTTYHLHFDCMRNIDGVAIRPPVYTSLVAAYRRAWQLDDLVSDGKLGVDQQREISEVVNDQPSGEVNASPKTWQTKNYGAITPQTEPDGWPQYIKTWPGLDLAKQVRDSKGKIIPTLSNDQSGVGLWWYWLVVRAGFNTSGKMTFRNLAMKYSGAQTTVDPSVINYLTNYVGAGEGGGGIAKLYFPTPPKADDELSLNDAETRWRIAQTVFHFEAGRAVPFGRSAFDEGVALGDRLIAGVADSGVTVPLVSPPAEPVGTGSPSENGKLPTSASCAASTIEITRQQTSVKLSGCLSEKLILEIVGLN
ncbi:M23 family metallopeptidase [Rhizobium ruizarguesonis]|uniref:M23 family metallopeptidase n=1 Tax=Rhizobium ruizarguesonis TaxID=2081791 RepID=UPI0013D0305A|nr:M23 family metallopeptidase [Rhizobium ruizarguesonis]NEH76844.1 peptidoglycan DD-metalloendopeptidase family protein [Rhizobium ruizarguesonis]